MQTKTHARTFVLLALLLAASGYSIAAQTRDHLTPQEVDLIKDAQALDLRTSIFIKAAERRMALVTGTAASTSTNSKQAKKDAELWGDTPKGTRAELIGDVAKILDEAITNIDDVSMHDEKSPLLPKALRKLVASATQIIDQLTPLRSQAKSEEEIANLEQAVENAQSIMEAAKKLPPPAEKEKKDKAKGGTPKEKP